MPPLVPQAHLFQGGQSPVPPLPPGDAGVHQGDLHVFQQVQPGQQIVLLKDEAQKLVAYLSQPVFVHPAHVLTAEEIGPLRGDIQTADDVHAGGLPRAGGAHDGGKLPGLNLKGDVVGGSDRAVPHGVVLAHILKGNQRHVRTLPVCRRDFRRRGRRTL